jgi:hypothetical protein
VNSRSAPIGHLRRRIAAVLGLRVSLLSLLVGSGVGALSVLPTYADVIELTTGERIEGKDAQLGLEGVSVEVGGQRLQFERAKVRAVYLGGPPATQGLRPGGANDAVQILKGLQSVTTAGVNYQNYAPRVLEAKVKIDEYLRQNRNDKREMLLAIDRSLGYYVLASSAWNANIVGTRRGASPDYASIGSSPLVAQCEPLMNLIRSSPISQVVTRGLDQATSLGILVSSAGPQPLWQCASQELSRAESLLGGQ